MDKDDFEDALYNAADATRKTPSYSEVKNSTPTDAQVGKFRIQLKRFLEALPGGITADELLEYL